jgi:hypothetical protein
LTLRPSVIVVDDQPASTRTYSPSDFLFPLRWGLLPEDPGFNQPGVLVDRDDPTGIQGHTIKLGVEGGSFWVTGFEVDDDSSNGLVILSTTHLDAILGPPHRTPPRDRACGHDCLEGGRDAEDRVVLWIVHIAGGVRPPRQRLRLRARVICQAGPSTGLLLAIGRVGLGMRRRRD